MLTLDQILDSLGGETAVAGLLRCGPSAITNWKNRGVPRGRWVDLVDIANERSISLTIDDVRKADAAIRDAARDAA